MSEESDEERKLINNIKKIKLMIINNNLDLNLVNYALFEAITIGSLKHAKYLVNIGATLNNDSCEYLTQILVNRNNINMIKYLISTGTINTNNTGAILVASKKQYETIKYLIGVGLEFSIIYDRSEIIKKLYAEHEFEVLQKLLENTKSNYLELKKQINNICENKLVNNIVTIRYYYDILFV